MPSVRYQNGLMKASFTSGTLWVQEDALGAVLQPSLYIPVKLGNLPSYDLMRKSIWKLQKNAVSNLFTIYERFPCDGLLNCVSGCWVWRPDGGEAAAALCAHIQPAPGLSTCSHRHTHACAGGSQLTPGPHSVSGSWPGPSGPSSSQLSLSSHWHHRHMGLQPLVPPQGLSLRPPHTPLRTGQSPSPVKMARNGV